MPPISPSTPSTSAYQRLMAWLAVFVLGLLWALALTTYRGLPEQIPSHWGFNGQPDAYSSRRTIFLVPIVISVLLLMLRLSRFISPKFYNFPVRVTKNNAKRQIHNIHDLLATLQPLLVGFFYWIEWQIIQAARHPLYTSLPPTVIFGFLLVLILVIVFFVIRAFRWQ